MSYSGYPTPDIDPNQEFVNVCIPIPSSVGDVFYQVLIGQISEMANDYYWKQDGTMSPDDCAFLWSQTLALISADMIGCGTMTCEEVADCIETDAGVQSAITNYLNGVGSGGTSSGGTAGGGSTTTIVLTNNPYDFLDGGVCDNDNMYAVAVKITQLAFETVNQLYQVIDQAISPLELAAEVADNAPAVATAVPATAGDWLVWVQDTAYDSWQVFDSPTRRTDVACDIFCIMVENNCSLTFDDLFNYFADKTVTAIFGVTLESVLLDMVDVLITDEIGWTSLAFLFACLSLGSKVAGVTNVGGFMTTIAAYIDETNNNWALECDPCAEPVQTAEWDFTLTDGGFIQSAGATARGVYVGGVGWTTSFNGNEGCLIQVELPANTIVKELSFDWDKDTAQSWAINGLMRDNPASATGQIVFFLTNSTALSGCAEGTQEGATHRNYLMIQIANGSVETMTGHITKCRIRYEGDTPALVTATGITVACP